MFRATLLFLLVHSATNPVVRADVRIKDLVDVEGIRTNTLTGLGLVTGLNGTGSESPLTREIAANLVQRYGLRLDPRVRAAIRDDTKQKTKNLSVVTVVAEIPATAKPGVRLNVTVSAYDDAESLQGGTLIMTPLLGVDGDVYATASGPVSTGGFTFSGDAATVQKNHPTTGVITSGAIVEKAVPNDCVQTGNVRLLLRNPDLETAARIAEVIQHTGKTYATVLDPGTIDMAIPRQSLYSPLLFVRDIESLRVDPDVAARVSINERTGTIVITGHVRVSKVAMTHANLSVVTGEQPEVVQPLPFSEGQTAAVPRTEIDVIEEKRPVHVLDETTTVDDLARALNALGVTPRDISSIFQRLKAANALHAELVFE